MHLHCSARQWDAVCCSPVPMSRTLGGLSTGASASLPSNRTVIACWRSVVRQQPLSTLMPVNMRYLGVLAQAAVEAVSKSALQGYGTW